MLFSLDRLREHPEHINPFRTDHTEGERRINEALEALVLGKRAKKGALWMRSDAERKSIRVVVLNSERGSPRWERHVQYVNEDN